jgi:DNA-binding CsgD family transcriptional regulator
MLTTFNLDEYVYHALKAGASGFLLKDASRQRLAGAVRAVAEGEVLLAPATTRRLIEDFCRAPAPDTPSPATTGRLSERELGVIQLIAQGLSNAEIAARLYLSEATIKSHVARILAKLGLRDRVQVTVLRSSVWWVGARLSRNVRVYASPARTATAAQPVATVNTALVPQVSTILPARAEQAEMSMPAAVVIQVSCPNLIRRGTVCGTDLTAAPYHEAAARDPRLAAQRWLDARLADLEYGDPDALTDLPRLSSRGPAADALATGWTGMLVLVAAALFGRDPRAAKRLAELLTAWRRG